jgi:hypothetical protein
MSIGVKFHFILTNFAYLTLAKYLVLNELQHKKIVN